MEALKGHARGILVNKATRQGGGSFLGLAARQLRQKAAGSSVIQLGQAVGRRAPASPPSPAASTCGCKRVLPGWAAQGTGQRPCWDPQPSPWGRVSLGRGLVTASTRGPGPRCPALGILKRARCRPPATCVPRHSQARMRTFPMLNIKQNCHNQAGIDPGGSRCRHLAPWLGIACPPRCINTSLRGGSRALHTAMVLGQGVL